MTLGTEELGMQGAQYSPLILRPSTGPEFCDTGKNKNEIFSDFLCFVFFITNLKHNSQKRIIHNHFPK